jgi:hypothetical protein
MQDISPGIGILVGRRDQIEVSSFGVDGDDKRDDLNTFIRFSRRCWLLLSCTTIRIFLRVTMLLFGRHDLFSSEAKVSELKDNFLTSVG